MLKGIKKIDVYKDPDAYDDAYPGYLGDLDYYLKKSKKGNVLYLGVGTGRIFGEIYKANKKTIGIDYSKDMVDRLVAKHPEMKGNLQIKDALKAQFPRGSFDLIIAPYSFLQCFAYKDVEKMLKRINPWLKKDGVFLTDAFSAFLIPFKAMGLEANLTKATDPKVSIYIQYDHLLQTMKELTVVESKGVKKLIEMSMWYHFPSEIVRALESAGFKTKTFGDYGKNGFSSKDHDVVVFESKK